MWRPEMRPSFIISISLLLLGVQHYSVRQRTYEAVQGNFLVPGLAREQFVQKGDINIGFMVGISACDDVISNPEWVIYPQVIAYAVQQINKDRLLPNNLTLGFTVLDDCDHISTATAQALAFVPQTSCPVSPEDTDGLPSHDVVAVIGAWFSSQAVALAHVLGPALIPLVSISATSDDLSNEALFPYFVRTVPPDKYQFRAIFSIILHYGWSYVSVIYNEGSYGENGFRQLRNLFDQNGVCLAAVHKIPGVFGEEEAEVVAKDIVDYSNARIVVMISGEVSVSLIIKAAGNLLPAGSFIWIASDAWATSAPSMTELGDHLFDAFLFSPLRTNVPEFGDWFLQLTLADTNDPWFAQYMEGVLNCSVSSGTCNTTVSTADVNYSLNTAYSFSGDIFDVVTLIANATSRVLQSDACEGLVGHAARACVTGPKLLSEMLATRQNGYSGWLEFDSHGDRLGGYIIRQVVPSDVEVFDVVDVAEFYSNTKELNMIKSVVWAHHDSSSNLDHPESKCSDPCGPHEARVMQEVTCCWLCQLCRDNERLIRNGTRCEACPTFSWPDPVTYNSTCLPIPPDRPRLNSVMGVVQTSLAILCLLACLVVFIFFHRHRQCRVIKASSRELSMLILLAIATGYVVMGTFLCLPTDFTCRLNFLFFCTSFTLIYGPLLVRALRIFRIFEASKMSARRPRMIDSSHQLFFSCVFLCIQLVICIVMMTVHPTWHKLTQTSPQERYVELACDLPMTGLVSFLAYNLLLVAVCTVLAFKTRHLPDNFNESRFISMCVSTKLVILLCFIPAYLVSGRELLKMQMLALAVALNHSVALIFLFLPKIYAVLYLEGAADINQTTMHRTGTVGVRTQISMMDAPSTQAGMEGQQREQNSSEGPHALPVSPNFKQVAPMS